MTSFPTRRPASWRRGWRRWGRGWRCQVIDQIVAGTTHGVKQDKAQVTKAPKLKKEDGLIDWTRSAEQVCNQIRAMQPWPTAYTLLHRPGKPPIRMHLTRAGPVLGITHDLARAARLPFAQIGRQSLLCLVGPAFATQEMGVVEILELQPAGKKRMTAAEFLRGHPIQPGDHFGPEHE